MACTMMPVTRVELADLVRARDTSIPATVFVMREGAEAASCRVVALRAPFEVLVAFDTAQSLSQAWTFADSLWASYAWYGTHKPTSLWTRVEAWLAEPLTAGLGEDFRAEYFPEWEEMRPEPNGWTPRPSQRPPSFVVDAKPLIGVEAPEGTWAEKRAAERHRAKERDAENAQRARDKRALLPALAPTASWHPPGTSHVVAYYFSSYHAALHVVSRLMGNTSAGAHGAARPLGGKVDTRLVWAAPPKSSWLDLQFYPHTGTPALYLLPRLPDVNARAMWRLVALPPALADGGSAFSIVPAVAPLMRDAVLRGGLPTQLDAWTREMWRLSKDTTTAVQTMLAQTRLYDVPPHALEAMPVPLVKYRLDGVVYQGLQQLRRARPGLRDKTIDPEPKKRPAPGTVANPAPAKKPRQDAGGAIDLTPDEEEEEDTKKPRGKEARKVVIRPKVDVEKTVAKHVRVTTMVVDTDATMTMWVSDKDAATGEVRMKEVPAMWASDMDTATGKVKVDPATGKPVMKKVPAQRELVLDTGEARAPMQANLAHFFSLGPARIPDTPRPAPPPRPMAPTGLFRFFTATKTRV